MNSPDQLERGHLLSGFALLNSAQLMQELSGTLAVIAEALQNTQLPDVEHGINFYEEVRQFEIELINCALRLAGGRQKKAAQLLNLKESTLNTKIKLYNIKRHSPDDT